MAKGSIFRGRDSYRLALMGHGDTAGLRQTASGFSSSNGYNLNKFESWTAAMRAKVRKYYYELQNLTAQPRELYTLKDAKYNKENFAKAQSVVQGKKAFKWKVAFIPKTPRYTKKGKLSKAKLRVSYTKDGIRIRERNYYKTFVPLDPVNLVLNPKKEILAAIENNASNAQRFVVQAGENQMNVPETKKFIVERVIFLMNRYDGKTAIPTSSKKWNDDPSVHDWHDWMHGLIAFQFPDVKADTIREAMNAWDEARKSLQRRRRNDRVKARNKGKRGSKRK